MQEVKVKESDEQAGGSWTRCRWFAKYSMKKRILVTEDCAKYCIGSRIKEHRSRAVLCQVEKAI